MKGRILLKVVAVSFMAAMVLSGAMSSFAVNNHSTNNTSNQFEDIFPSEDRTYENIIEVNVSFSYDRMLVDGDPDFVAVNHKPRHIEIEINYSKLSYQIIYNRENEATILMPSFGKNVLVGEPELPLKLCDLALPPNVKRDSIKLQIIELRVADLGSGFDIPPVLPPEMCIHDESKNNFGVGGIEYERRGVVYKNDSFYPSIPIRISSPSQMRKWIFISLELWPFQYNPQKEVLQRIDFVKCSIDYEVRDELEEKTQIGLFDTVMDSSAQKKFINYNYAKRWYESGRTQIASKDTKDYIIVTTNNIVSNSTNLNRFIKCKENFGFSVKVITENDYGDLSGQPPNGTAEKIRQWLIDNYIGLGIEYVLLIGDPDPDDPTDLNDFVGEIPMKMLYPRVGNGYYWDWYESPSDYFYADLTGNWNLDGDDLFGECEESDQPDTPDPRIEKNTFSIRWTGKINVTDENGSRIAAYYDDGVRIWMDNLFGDPVINDWNDHVSGHSCYDILSPGLHNIKIEYYQNKSNAFFRLLKGPVGASWFYTIPASDLYYWNGTSYQPGGLNAEYFNDINLTDFVFTRVDPDDPSHYFHFKWFSGDIGEGGVDFAPEVYVGRIPIYNNNYSQLDEILDKLIKYQNPLNTSWRRSVLLPMKPMDESTLSYQLGEQIRTDFCEPFNFSYYRIYDEEYGCIPPPEATPCTQDNVLAALQNGYGLVSWFTHGSSTSASSVFDSYSCYLLDDNKPAFTFQGSCYNGYPESNDNLGYSLLKHGAAATVSASRVSWYARGSSSIYPNDRYIQGFCYFYSSYVIQNNTTGESLSFIKDIPANSSNDFYWMNIFDFNLYGDPSIEIISSQRENRPPIASFTYTPKNPVVNEMITFNASNSTDPDGWLIITKYEWDFGDENITSTTDEIIRYAYSSIGNYTVNLTVTDSDGATNLTSKVVIVQAAPDTTPPLSITNLSNLTGQTWINWTWTNPPDADFNHTMVFINGSFVKNVSKPLNYYNGTYLPHATRTISTHTVDTGGNINSTWVNQTTTIPNNLPVLESIGAKTVDEGQKLTIDANATDIDGDNLTYSCNRTDLFTDFNRTTGIGNWTPSSGQAGTYYIDFGVSDGYGGVDNETVKITMKDKTPPASIANLQNTTGTTWINWTWTNPSDTDFNYTMVYLDGKWKTNTSYPFYNATGLIPNTNYTISTHTVDKVGNVNATWINQTTKTQAENIPPVASFTYFPEPPFYVYQLITFNASSSYDIDGNITKYEWNFGDGNITNTTDSIITHSYASSGDYAITLTVTDDDGATNSTTKLITVSEKLVFDTGPGTYPSIFGTHNGTITPNQTITVNKLYTYPCPGTGGHSEYVKIWNDTWGIEATWNGYEADWHNITFPNTFTLKSGEAYNYTIETGSYPQIIHKRSKEVSGGKITCAEFIDANGFVRKWIPAIKLE